MAQNVRKDDGRIGKEIDWSLVVPSITRPVWEPPALEVLDHFEEYGEDFSFNLDTEAWRRQVPDIKLRLRWLDLSCEVAPLDRYSDWVRETLKAAKEAGSQEKIAFYEDLYASLRTEFREVTKELNSFIIDHGGLGSPISGGSSDGETKDKDAHSEVETSDTESTASFVTANGDVSIPSNEERGDLINLNLSSTRDTEASIDINAIQEETNDSVHMGVVDRPLS